jgi:sugar phosphate isomerase/epimerase
VEDGGVDWPAIRKEIDQINFSGWMTIEGSGELSVEERSRRLDRMIAGTL